MNSTNMYYSIDCPSYLSLCRGYGFIGAFKIENIKTAQNPKQVLHVNVTLRAIKE